MWNTRHGEIAGPGADKHNLHPEPGLERNGKTKEENKEDAQNKLYKAMTKERELGGLMNVKNEEKMGKDIASIPSLKDYDKENGLTGSDEKEE